MDFQAQQAILAKEALWKKFNRLSMAQGASVRKDDKGYYVAMLLARELTEKEKKRLPTVYKGFRVTCDVIGKILAKR